MAPLRYFSPMRRSARRSFSGAIGSVDPPVGGAVGQGVGDEFVGRQLRAEDFGRVVAAVGVDQFACLTAEVEFVLEPESGRARVEMSNNHGGVFVAALRRQLERDGLEGG